MFGKITEFAIQANRITILVLVGIPLIGLLVFLNYPRQEDPSIEIRQAIVTASHPGMKVYQVEDLITRTLEEKIREIGEVDDVWSSSQDGRTTIYVEVDDWVAGPEIKRVWQMLRNKMSDAVPELPEGTNGPLVNDEFGLTALATIALWSDGFSPEEMRRVARDARRQLDSLAGVERIELFGLQPERIFLTASNTRLAGLGIPPQAIVDKLQAQNVILPGGTINAAGQSVRIEASGTFDSVTEIEDVLVPIPGSEKTIALKDIVEVVRGRQRHRRCRSNAQPPGSGRRPSAGSSGNSARPGPTAVDLDADDRSSPSCPSRSPKARPGNTHADDVLLVSQDVTVSCGEG